MLTPEAIVSQMTDLITAKQTRAGFEVVTRSSECECVGERWSWFSALNSDGSNKNGWDRPPLCEAFSLCGPL